MEERVMSGSNRLRTRTSAIALVGLMSVISACSASPSSGGTGSSAPAGKPLVIGASVSLTGDFADPGKAVKAGYELWAKEVNAKGGILGRQVEFKIVDDTSSPDPGRDELPEPDQPGQG